MFTRFRSVFASWSLPSVPFNEDYYLIDLSEDEQREIYAILDDQCKRYYEKSCADLLEEARREMEADV